MTFTYNPYHLYLGKGIGRKLQKNSYPWRRKRKGATDETPCISRRNLDRPFRKLDENTDSGNFWKKVKVCGFIEKRALRSETQLAGTIT